MSDVALEEVLNRAAAMIAAQATHYAAAPRLSRPAATGTDGAVVDLAAFRSGRR